MTRINKAMASENPVSGDISLLSFLRQVEQDLIKPTYQEETLVRIEEWFHGKRCSIWQDVDGERADKNYFEEVDKLETASLTWKGLTWEYLCGSNSSFVPLGVVSRITEEVLICLRSIQETGTPIKVVEREDLHRELDLDTQMNEDFRVLCVEFVDNLVCSLDKLLVSTGAFREVNDLAFWAPWTAAWFGSSSRAANRMVPASSPASMTHSAKAFPAKPLQQPIDDLWPSSKTTKSKITEGKINKGSKKRFPRCRVCPLCPGKQFHFEIIPEDHLRLKHPAEVNSLRCSLCSCYFPDFQALKSHLEQAHLEFSWECSPCRMVFESHKAFLSHCSRLHNDEVTSCSNVLTSQGSHSENLETKDNNEHDIERILAASFQRKEKLKYLVRWKDHGPAYDQWLDPSQIRNSQHAIQKFEGSRPTYIVSKIVAKTLNPHDEALLYLVRWKGYGPESDMWCQPSRLPSHIVQDFEGAKMDERADLSLPRDMITQSDAQQPSLTQLKTKEASPGLSEDGDETVEAVIKGRSVDTCAEFRATSNAHREWRDVGVKTEEDEEMYASDLYSASPIHIPRGTSGEHDRLDIPTSKTSCMSKTRKILRSVQNSTGKNTNERNSDYERKLHEEAAEYHFGTKEQIFRDEEPDIFHNLSPQPALPRKSRQSDKFEVSGLHSSQHVVETVSQVLRSPAMNEIGGRLEQHILPPTLAEFEAIVGIIQSQLAQDINIDYGTWDPHQAPAESVEISEPSMEERREVSKTPSSHNLRKRKGSLGTPEQQAPQPSKKRNLRAR